MNLSLLGKGRERWVTESVPGTEGTKALWWKIAGSFHRHERSQNTESMHIDWGRAKKAGGGLLELDHLGLSRAP